MQLQPLCTESSRLILILCKIWGETKSTFTIFELNNSGMIVKNILQVSKFEIKLSFAKQIVSVARAHHEKNI